MIHIFDFQLRSVIWDNDWAGLYYFYIENTNIDIVFNKVFRLCEKDDSIFKLSFGELTPNRITFFKIKNDDPIDKYSKWRQYKISKLCPEFDYYRDNNEKNFYIEMCQIGNFWDFKLQCDFGEYIYNLIKEQQDVLHPDMLRELEEMTSVPVKTFKYRAFFQIALNNEVMCGIKKEGFDCNKKISIRTKMVMLFGILQIKCVWQTKQEVKKRCLEFYSSLSK